MRRAGASAEDGIRFRFKQQYTQEQRKQEADAILQKYPQRIPAVTKRYSLRGRERHSSEMNGDEAETCSVGVADSDAGGQRSGTSDTASNSS
ncbi:hypothetical protein HPB50_008131 [Hyalomma asiaticum]|uniref:Uncharacterized protein n=1 Tax=Hyalomma asiaticum TaxID=266040 RepID=A0ACB7TDY6_HYAAI|nr:hypothetical protein HPB50_008131 [Hyalomma asiaticum]